MFKTVGGGGGRGVHCIDILNAPPTKLTRGEKKKRRRCLRISKRLGGV